ncbi:MAG: glucose-6-phosphate isomerase [Calditrichota bacterium]
MNLRFKYRNLMAEAGGIPTGLQEAELRELEPVFTRTREDLQRRHKAGELPFWDLPFQEKMIQEVQTFAEEELDWVDNFVLLGIGGSALGANALHAALNHTQHNLLHRDQRRGARFFCPDNVDPDLVSGVLDVVDIHSTLFNVVSKSGGTAETAAQFIIILDLLKRRFGEGWRKHLVLTTDPHQGLLRKFAQEQGVRAFPIDPGVGGRFTVFTPVGLLPAAFTGIDIEELCAGARTGLKPSFEPQLEKNIPALMAAVLFLMQTKRNRPMHVFFAYSNRLYYIADWMRQLWAESLGKRLDLQGREVFTGPTPLKAVGATDQHSQVQLYIEGPQDKVIIFLGTNEFDNKITIPPGIIETPETNYLGGAELGLLLNAERRATRQALTEAGRPSLTIEIDRIDPPHVGALMFMLEAATLYAGGFYNVNPLDQPGVEAGKKATYALMGRAGYEDLRGRLESETDAEKYTLSISD